MDLRETDSTGRVYISLSKKLTSLQKFEQFAVPSGLRMPSALKLWLCILYGIVSLPGCSSCVFHIGGDQSRALAQRFCLNA